MKHSYFLNLGLSAIFAAVLAACGGSSSDNVKQDNNPPTTPPEKEDNGLDAQKAAWLQSANVRFANLQTAKNNESDMGTNPIAIENNYHNNTPATNRDLHRSLDTIVIATPRSSNSVTAYLEDFEFTGHQAVVGNPTLDKIMSGQQFSQAFGAVKTTLETVVDNLGDHKPETYKKTFEDALKKADEKFKEDSDKATTSEDKLKLKLAHEMTTALLKASSESLIAAAEEAAATSATFNATEAKKVLSDEVFTDYYEAYLGLELGAGIFDRASGKVTLNNIYLNRKTTKNNVNRDPQTDLVDITETKTRGEDKGEALVLQTGRKIYFTGVTAADAAKIHADARATAGTVAEVYGNKTFGYVVQEGTKDYDIKNDAGVNAPFAVVVGEGKYEDGKLEYVQYGRVTSAMHSVVPSALKDGRLNNTVVASFGKQGEKGTEDHYFARGYNNVESTEKTLGTSGQFVYNGHAVANGLDNSYDDQAQKGVPNAIGGAAQIVSGNHVRIVVDAATKDVAGSLYNVWEDAKGLRKVDLVKIKGALGANGNLAGEANLTYRNDEAAKGTFLASLYGAAAEEMGGKVQSNSLSGQDGWVAVFGAKKAEAASAKDTGSPWDPRNEFDPTKAKSSSTTTTGTGN